MRAAPTVYDVAERARVSIATVSRVVGDHPNVAVATRERVERAIADLGWRPSSTARALARKSHGAVGIVFPDISGPYYAEVIRGFERRSANRAAVHILATHGRPEADDLVHDLAERVDGLVVMAQTVGDDVVTSLIERGLPVLCLARPPVAGGRSLRADNDTSARELGAHLLEHGHTRLAFVGRVDGAPEVRARHDGLAATWSAAGHPAPIVVPTTGYRVGDGTAAFDAAWDNDDPPTAIAAANDQLAMGLGAAATARGLEVGRDVAITGWDDQATAALVDPPLTTVAQPMVELGARAADAVLDGPDPSGPVDVVLPTHLVVRRSCGCGGQPATASTATTT